MTPRERFLTVLRGGDADRVPLLLQGFCRARIEDAKEPAEREILERIIQQTHFFVNCPSHINRWLITPPQRIARTQEKHADGNVLTISRIDTPKGELTAIEAHKPTTRTVWTVKYPVESLGDIGKIRSVPWQLPRDLEPPDPARLPRDFAARGVLRTTISSPFVCVAGLMPYQYFLELCATELGLMKELSALCLERTMAVLDVLLSRSGIEYVWMGGCEWLTPPMASARVYEELVQRFERPIIERVHAAGALCHVHCHGRVRSTLESVIARGADFFEPVEPPPDGDITFAEAKAIAGGRITLGGNIEARLLTYGSLSEVEAAARAAFEGGKARMVLMDSVGPIAQLSPTQVRNYHRVIEVWEELAPM